MGKHLLTLTLFLIISAFCLADPPLGTFVVVGEKPNFQVAIPTNYHVFEQSEILGGDPQFMNVGDFTFREALRDMLVFSRHAGLTVFARNLKGNLVRFQVTPNATPVVHDIEEFKHGADFRWFSPTEIISVVPEKKQLVVYNVAKGTLATPLTEESFLPTEFTTFHVGRAPDGLITLFTSRGAKHDAYLIECFANGTATLHKHWDIDPARTKLPFISQKKMILRPDDSIFLFHKDINTTPAPHLLELLLKSDPLRYIRHHQFVEEKWNVLGWRDGLLLSYDDDALYHYDVDTAKLTALDENAFALTRFSARGNFAHHLHLVQLPHSEDGWAKRSSEFEDRAYIVEPKKSPPLNTKLLELRGQLGREVALDTVLTNVDIAMLDARFPLDQKTLGKVLGKFGLAYSPAHQAVVALGSTKSFTVKEWLEAVIEAAPCESARTSVAVSG